MTSATSAPVTVAVAHGNALLLAAMGEVFVRDSRFSLVATAATAEGFLTTVLRMPVQVGVIDWAVPALGGQNLLQVLRSHPTAPRLVIYGEPDSDVPRKALAAGAAGFAALSGTIETLLDTCLSVARGQMVFPFLDIRDLQRDPIEQLSRRERGLLEALSRGLTNRELARDFEISTNTVKFHLSNLYDKLAVRNRAQAIAFYYAHKPPSP